MTKHILVIEDNTDVRENIVEILQLDGYEVSEAPNGKVGVEQALSNRPDLILCDIMMPELDGFGTLKILNRNAKTHDIPFIFLTAKAEKDDFRRGMGLGADDYITKPFDDTELLDAIEMRLRKKEAMRTNTESAPPEHFRQFINLARAEEGLKTLSEDRESRNYQERQHIYQAGANPRYLYLIQSGKVKTYQVNEVGKELITHIYGPGHFLGYLPLLQDTTYSDSAMAMEAVSVLLIPKSDFEKILFSNTDFSSQFIKMIAKETIEVEQKLIDVAYGSVRKKVANTLLSLAHFQDLSINKYLDMSRDDLSKRVGIAKETLIRTLSDFKAENIIDILPEGIVIKNTDALRSMPM